MLIVFVAVLYRFDTILEDRSSLLVGSRSPDSVTSMKNLIAAAQAKRRQAHSQHLAFGNSGASFLAIADMHGISPSSSMVQNMFSISNSLQQDLQQSAGTVSPSTNGTHSASRSQINGEEIEERRTSSGPRDVGGSLSGDTEAVVARDAFEGMIETLSRTKESIGRATRLAIDCAKYGIANEVG